MSVNEESTLYEGKFFTVTPTLLNIKLYYFPFGSKVIQLAKIKSIHTAPELSLTFLKMKTARISLFVFFPARILANI